MKNLPSRRSFLQKTVMATTGVALLSSKTVINALTKDDSPFSGYNPYAEEKTDLRTSSLFGKHLFVNGKIYDKSGKSTLSNVSIEVWHLSPDSKQYKHKAKLKTNNLGEYEFITDFPNKEFGKMSRIYFKVSNDFTSYFTELLVDDFGVHITGKHWEENQRLGDNLFPLKDNSVITFNISI